MYFKHFTRLFLLIGMIGLLSTPVRADEVQIGSGSETQPWLPSHSYYKYSLTQQIYTASEISSPDGGTITSISFYNKGTAKTRTLEVYLVNTDKTSFSGTNDCIIVGDDDKVFDGSVSLTANQWTPIVFDNDFDYEGGNLAVVINDKTGGYENGQSCLVFTPSANPGTQSWYRCRDGSTPYDATNPTSGNSSQSAAVTYKNQIKLNIESSSVTCAKPKNYTATDITAHSTTLTWTAGSDDQSNWEVYLTTSETAVPDENTTPSYQVTECSKALDNLTAQTTYYAYVRANCDGGDKSKWTNTNFTTTREALAVDATNPYSQDFEDNNDWSFTNGTQTNKWCWGNAANNGGEKAIYVSNDNGTSYAYTLNSTTVAFVSKLFNFAQGTYTFVFDWQAKGEGSSYTQYDYLRAALVPGDVNFTAGTLPSGVGFKTLPNSWIALDGGQQLNLQNGWQSQTAEASVSGTYTMVFLWRNDSGGGNQPPAAIDNISINYMTCPRPSGLNAGNIAGRTATLNWTENGTTTNWVLQYATNNSFTENLSEVSVSGAASKDLTGLMPETKYYARVKSVLGNDESSWSDVIDFTTTATCERPTLSYISYSSTAYSGAVQWTGNANGYELAYRPTSDFDPADETLQDVIRIQLGSVNTYTLEQLTPETKYYIYVQANCGEEDGNSSWSNRTIFTTLATCLEPSNLSTLATSSTITLNWTAGAEGQDAWDIRYKKNTDSEYTYIHLDNHPATEYTITGLSPVTTYGVNVRAWCDEYDQSKWGAGVNQTYDKSVTTACGAIDLPYTCDFEGTSQTVNNCTIPSCWSVIRGYYNSTYRYGVPTMATPSTSTQPVVAATHSGSYSLYFLNSTNYGTSEEYAILPEISENYMMNNIQIRFWARSYSSPCSMEVGIMTDPSDANTYVQVEVVEMTNTYTEKTINLNNCTGKGRYIALKCPAPTMYSQAFYVDDITVEYLPSCMVPSNLEANEVTENRATLTWTAGNDETNWNIQYKKASSEDWSELIPVSTTTYLLTGLQRATIYDARVQAVCSDEDQSEWTEISFTTECGVWPINAGNRLFENFENVEASDFPPICWSKFHYEMSGNTNSYWYLNSNNGLGSNAAYSYWNEGYGFFVTPKMHIEGEATLSFDYLIGPGNYNESCSVVVSTNDMTFDDFSTTVWEANGSNSGNAQASVSLADFDGEDIYIAFKFKGSGTNGCTWYVDNIEVSVPATQTVELTQGWNWFVPTVETSLADFEEALGDKGIIIKTQTENITYEDEEWMGDEIELIPGHMYKIEVNENCSFVLTGESASNVTITINYGSNWFGYTGLQEASIEQILTSCGFTPSEGDLIKTATENTIFEDGEWLGDFETLQPGKGYIYVSQDTETKQLSF